MIHIPLLDLKTTKTGEHKTQSVTRTTAHKIHSGYTWPKIFIIIIFYKILLAGPCLRPYLYKSINVWGHTLTQPSNAPRAGVKFSVLFLSFFLKMCTKVSTKVSTIIVGIALYYMGETNIRACSIVLCSKRLVFFRKIHQTNCALCWNSTRYCIERALNYCFEIVSGFVLK